MGKISFPTEPLGTEWPLQLAGADQKGLLGGA
jgi:hypothetical protein